MFQLSISLKLFNYQMILVLTTDQISTQYNVLILSYELSKLVNWMSNPVTYILMLKIMISHKKFPQGGF